MKQSKVKLNLLKHNLMTLGAAVLSAIAQSSLADTERFAITAIEGLNPAAEAYFSPDSKSLIFNAKFGVDANYFVYTANIDGTAVRKINGWGEDGCSFFFPSGDRIIWTSTRDFPYLGGNYSDPANYPQGAELYESDLFGNNVRRLTNNRFYDAEVSISPNGQWIVFTRQLEGKLDLWIMKGDGTQERQITFTPEWQEGGSVFMPDNETIVYRAWKIGDQGRPGGLPMTLFMVHKDGSNLRALTDNSTTHWAPYPAPDGEHVAYVKIFPPHNYEIVLRNLITGNEMQLTHHSGFDGFPAFSPDGQWIAFSSSRSSPPGSRALGIHLMDISALGLGPKKGAIQNQ